MRELQVPFLIWTQFAERGLRLYHVVQSVGYDVFACGDEYFIYSEVRTGSDIEAFESTYYSSSTEVESRDDAFARGLIGLGVRLVGTQPALEADHRMVVVNFPADEGSFMWLTGAGDDVENQVRGGGPRLSFTFTDVVRTEPEVQTIDLQFLEQIQLHDGQMTVTNPSQWDTSDVWNFCIHMPASEVVENLTGTGNCNVVDGYVVVPAAGDGAYDVDMGVAVPVPASGAGFWDYDSYADLLEVSAEPGSASWHVLLVPVDAYFMRNVTVPLHPAGNFDFDAYKAERVVKRWVLRLSVSKSSSGPGKLTGWVVMFREQNT